MATKSKKSKLYRLRYKGMAVFLFFTFAVSIFFCGIVGVNISRNWSWDVINADTVYDTEEFREAFSRTLDRAVQADIYYQNEDRVSKGAAVDRNDLLNGFKRYYGIIDGIITAIRKSMPPMTGCFCMGRFPKACKEIWRNIGIWWKAVCLLIIKCISRDSWMNIKTASAIWQGSKTSYIM